MIIFLMYIFLKSGLFDKLHIIYFSFAYPAVKGRFADATNNQYFRQAYFFSRQLITISSKLSGKTFLGRPNLTPRSLAAAMPCA